MTDLASFQSFLYQNIPLVGHMQLVLKDISSSHLEATAPITPNINDKQTVFGGSSAALMTICGWSLIKYHLEHNQMDHDVVIYQAKNQWHLAQKDDLNITAQLSLTDQDNSEAAWDWLTFCEQLKRNNRYTKIKITAAVRNHRQQLCSSMQADYVILKK